MDTIRVSNDLDPDQDRRSVGPNLDPNVLQMISVDDKSRFLQNTYIDTNQFYQFCYHTSKR